MTNDGAIRGIAEAISRYLMARPTSEATLEGIADSWLKHQRVACSLESLEAALALLVDRGQLKRKIMPDGQTLYQHVDA